MTTFITDSTSFALKKFSVALTAAAVKEATDMTNLMGPAPMQGDAGQILKGKSDPGLPGVWINDLTANKAGTQVTIEAVDAIGGYPIMGNQMREGKGDTMQLTSMEAKIDLASKVIFSMPGKMIDQRTKIDLRRAAMDALRGYFPRLLWNRTLVQLAGARGAQYGNGWYLPRVSDVDSATFASMLVNPVKAPTYNRHLVVDGVNLVQGGQQLASIDSTDTLKLSHIDTLAAWYDTQHVKMMPIRVPGDPSANSMPIRGVLYVDPLVYQQLLTDTTANYNMRNWMALANERANLMRGERHPLFTGEMAMWNRILIKPMEHSIYFNPGDTTKIVTQANRYTATETDGTVNGSLGAGYRVSRSIFMSAQAFGVVVGNNPSSGLTASVYERVFDYKSKHEIMAEWMGGETKLRFSFKDQTGALEPTDFGVAVIDSVVPAVGQ